MVIKYDKNSRELHINLYKYLNKSTSTVDHQSGVHKSTHMQGKVGLQLKINSAQLF